MFVVLTGLLRSRHAKGGGGWGLSWLEPSDSWHKLLSHADRNYATRDQPLGTFSRHSAPSNKNGIVIKSFWFRSIFSRSRGLCSDVLVEICEYLTLMDGINAFSLNILPLLRQAHSKVHLNDPSTRFLEVIPQGHDPSQVVSLRLTVRLRVLSRYLSSFLTFDQLIRVTAVSEQETHAIDRVLHGILSATSGPIASRQLFAASRQFSTRIHWIAGRCLMSASRDESIWNRKFLPTPSIATFDRSMCLLRTRGHPGGRWRRFHWRSGECRTRVVPPATSNSFPDKKCLGSISFHVSAFIEGNVDDEMSHSCKAAEKINMFELSHLFLRSSFLRNISVSTR